MLTNATKSVRKRVPKAARKTSSNPRGEAGVKRVAKTATSNTYAVKQSLVWLVREVSRATPIERVALERIGVRGLVVKEFASKMNIPATRFFDIIRVPKATAAKKAAADQMIDGASGQAELGMVRLLGITENIVKNSTSEEARSFDAAKWLGAWIERPQPVLGGKKPAELLDTPTGFEIVAKVLGAIESGAYL